VIGICSVCHNGTTAMGKPVTHIASPSTCDNCHNTNNWTSVVFDHAGVPGTCSSCHNGTTAAGKPATHVSTSASCDSCHSTVAWTPASFDHAAVTGSCSTCHNGTTATGKPATHFVTSLQCDQCHNTSSWSGIVFRHSSADYPGDHISSVGCTDCHQTNSQTATWTAPAYQPDCAGCHASRYKPGPHKKYESPDTFYTVSELRDCAGACHMYTDSSLTKIKESRSGRHRTNSGEF
jgi:hypothetical protein